jgi:hypothetical protein
MRKSRVRQLRKALLMHDARAAFIEPRMVNARIATFRSRLRRLKEEYTHGRR